MQLQDQVISLELAQQLKEAGVPQESLFYWVKHRQTAFQNPLIWFTAQVHEWNNVEFENASALQVDVLGSAFTVAELGEIMKDKGMGVMAYSSLVRKEWWVKGGEWVVEKQQYTHIESDEKWADALGKMLLYLINQKLCECCNKPIKPKSTPYKWDREDAIRIKKSNQEESLRKAELARELGGEFMSAAYF